MRARTAPRWLGRMILHDELRGIGLPFVPEAVAFKPADYWLTYGDRLKAVAVTAALVRGMQRRGIAVGDELRSAAWRCTVAGLRRLPRERWPWNRQHVAVLHDRPAEQRPAFEQRDAEPVVIRRRGEGGQHAD